MVPRGAERHDAEAYMIHTPNFKAGKLSTVGSGWVGVRSDAGVRPRFMGRRWWRVSRPAVEAALTEAGLETRHHQDRLVRQRRDASSHFSASHPLEWSACLAGGPPPTPDPFAPSLSRGWPGLASASCSWLVRAVFPSPGLSTPASWRGTNS